MAKTIQMTWCLGPGKDWLAWVDGIHAGALTKKIGALKIVFFNATPETWLVPSVYGLPVDRFYRGKRNGEMVHFYVAPDGKLERLDRREFVHRAFERFESREPVVDFDDEVAFRSSGHRLAAWFNEQKWSRSNRGSYWRDVEGAGRLVIHQQGTRWVGSIFSSEDNWHGPERASVDEAKQDLWERLVKERGLNPEFPICTGCVWQEFGLADPEFGGSNGCANNCDAELV